MCIRDRMLIIAGGMNHVLILMSRWIFLRDSYGMSSRYALQFQVGILGIVLTAGLLWDRLKGKWIRIAAAAWCVIMPVSYTHLDVYKRQ